MMEVKMSAHFKTSLIRTMALILLGIAALFCGLKWVAVLIPLALLVRYSAVERSLGGNRTL
jgi:hypothetical protein